MAPLDFSGDQFSILPIRIPPLPSYSRTAIHEVRIRRNAPKVPTANDSRSLFLKNVPVDSTEPHFREIFTTLVGAGRFESIVFENEATAALSIDPAQATKVTGFAHKRKRTETDAEERDRERETTSTRLPEIWTRRLHQSSGSAVALFADEKSVQLVLKSIAKIHKSNKYPVWGENVADKIAPLGGPWVSAHLQLCRSDKLDTQRAVHAFFDAFNRREKEASDLAKKLRNEPDEDGFVTVTRGGRTAPASRGEAEEAKRKMVDKETKKKSEMNNFYRFQLRERRKQEQAALLRRFEEDKRKVQAMREKRGKFKPEA